MLTATIPAYPYSQYYDDPDIQAFFKTFNAKAQEYVDFFNQINLPIYTADIISGALLDWVAQGIYGVVRVPLPNGSSQPIGMIGTIPFGVAPFGKYRLQGPKSYFDTTDDIFKRIITWNFFKGDGQVFSIRWLKRRIMRFLNGMNGIDPGISQTYAISVTFGGGNQVNIRVISSTALFQGGSVGSTPFTTLPFGSSKLKITMTAVNSFSAILKSAIDAGILELPFQYTYVVEV